MSVVDRVRAAYETARRLDRPEIWTSLRDEAAVLDEARALDARVAAGAVLPFAGLLLAVKDNIDVAGTATTAGARSYAYLPEVDAPSVARLRDRGAVVLGKTNLDQFATGLVGARSPFGAVRNAWDPRYISGGSSSGSAVAVALGIVDLALGTDTAGSGRVPAALNGIWGVKPTRGRVPATGVVPACRSLDCVTVFARTAELADQAVRAMDGADGADPLASRPRPGARVGDDARDGACGVPGGLRYRVAVPVDAELGELAPGWAEQFARVVGVLRGRGVEVVPVSIAPLLEAAALLYGGAFVAERYAAVGAHIAAHPELVGGDLDPTVAAIVLGGSSATAVELFEDQQRLEVLRAQGARIFADVDALLTPTTTSHPTLAEVEADPVGVNSRLGRFTNYANLLDMCALAVPAGVVDGRPFGVMLTAPAFADAQLLTLSRLLRAQDVELFVVGAHLSGQPLNHELQRAGAQLVGPTETAAAYRLFELGTVPAKPGMLRTARPGGESIRGELWRVPTETFGAFVAALPRPMTIGTVDLADGRAVRGFLCEAEAVEGARDITGYRSWLAWLASREVS